MGNTANIDKNFSWFWEKLDAYLRTQDLKQTRQRKMIIERFLKLDSHVCAEDLHDNLRQDGMNIGLSTIYRTLNLLLQAGVVEQQSFADGHAVYEIDLPGKHHDHLVCLSCGKIVEFFSPTIEQEQRTIAKNHNFELTSHRHDLYGHCLLGCSKKNDQIT